MGSILKRTAFMEVQTVNGIQYYKPFDWAMCVTTVGEAAEPYMMNQRYGIMDTVGSPGDSLFDYKDDLSKINEIICIDPNKGGSFLGGDNVHGGNLIPRKDNQID